MKTNLHRTLVSLLALFLLSSGAVFTASCSKADATTKKEKSKKAAKEEPETETETGDHGEEPKGEHASETDKPDAEKGEKEAAKADEKKKSGHDAKEPGKSSAKDAKTAGEEIWSRLAAGDKRFMAGKHTTINYAAARKSLVKGQKPEVIVLGCADSRVPPEFVFDRNLGELFVVRDAGNIPDKVSLGSIEYAVEHLHAKALLILGHESCGAVAAAVSGEEMPTTNLTAIVDAISPAFEGSKTCIIGQPANMSCVELNVKQSSDDVIARSPILKKAVREGHLSVMRAVYKMETGEVVRLD